MAENIAPPTGLLTIAQAADKLGVRPWDVMRLIESGRMPTVTLVPAAALPHSREAK